MYQHKYTDAKDESSSITLSPASSRGTLSHLLQKNRAWADRVREINPNFFTNLVEKQSPQILWIGCSDSRVPANEIIDLLPGEVFVLRNIANVVVHTDISCLAVLQYAVDVLKVKHVIVCGHYGCGGVQAALHSKQYGLIDNWLRHIKDIYRAHKEHLDQITNEKEKWDLLTELNVLTSLEAVCHTTIVQNAWQRKQPLTVHAWCYRLDDGYVRDLHVSLSGPEQVPSIYNMLEKKREPEK